MVEDGEDDDTVRVEVRSVDEEIRMDEDEAP